MANLYDRPVGGQFIDMYVPIPFEQIAQAGARRQERYDVAEQGMESIYDAAQALRYIPGSEDEQIIKEKVIPRIKEIRDKYAKKDLSNPLVQRQMRKELESKVNKNLIGEMQQSYTQWLEDEKLVKQYKARDMWHPGLDEQPRGQGYSTQQEGVYGRISSPYVNPMGEVDKLFSTQGYMKGRELSYDEQTGVLIEGRTEEDVAKIAETDWYKLSENTRNNILMDYSHRNPDVDLTSPKVREEAVKEFIRERGETAFTWADKQRGWQPRQADDSRLGFWQNPVDIGRNLKLQQMTEIPGMPLKTIPLRTFKFDEEEKLIKADIPSEEEAAYRAQSIAVMTGQESMWSPLDVEEIEENIDKRFEKQTKLLNTFRNKFPVYADSTDAEVLEGYTKLLDTMNNRAVNFMTIPEAVSEAQTTELLQNITQRKIKIVDSEGNIFEAPINARGRSNTIKKKLGMSMSQFKEAIKEIGVGAYTNDLDQPMMAQIDGIEGKGGELYTVYMDTSDTMQRYGNVTNKAYRAFITMDDTPFPVERDEEGRIIYMRPIYPSDPTRATDPQFELGYLVTSDDITDKTPAFSPIDTRSLNEIQELEYARLLASPTILTDINYYTGQKPRPAHF